MDLVAGLREWKNAEIGEDKGKLITYMSSLEINDIYSLIKKNTVCEGLNGFSKTLINQGVAPEF